MNLRKLSVILTLGAGLIGAAGAAQAEEAATKQPLDELFGRTVIVPFDYNGKVFVNGSKVDVYGEYAIVERDGRVMVPIRLMSYLATQADHSRNWEANWQASKPDEVLLTNAALKKTITFKVNDRTMLVNNEPHAMDVAPQLVDGRIVLPLRSAAEALGKQIDWLDGLILLGDEPVHLQHARTAAVKSSILAQLRDDREAVPYEKALYPLTKFGDTSYYVKPVYAQDGSMTEKLYALQDGERTGTAIELPGSPILSQAKVIGHELYYVSALNGTTLYSGPSALYAYDFVTKQNRKLADTDWENIGGWLADVRYVDESLYVTLHTGELTMGGETIYRVENGALTELANAKNVINFVKNDRYVYMTDFRFMYDMKNNLSRIDTMTGEETVFGQPDYAYGIHSATHAGGGYSHAAVSSLYVKDGFLYTLGYKETDPEDISAVYRIDLKDQSQVKLTGPAYDFWLENGVIYYADPNDGKLKAVDADGGEVRTVIDKPVLNVRFHNGSIYYTVNANRQAHEPGVLYQHIIAWGLDKKRSEQPVTSYYAGDAGVYYVANGYEPGLFRIGQDGTAVRIVKDNVAGAVMTESGVAYALAYAEGAFSVK